MSKQQNKTRLCDKGSALKVSAACVASRRRRKFMCVVFAIISAAAGSFSCRRRPQRFTSLLSALVS
jgi:hypothetical protein